LQIILEITCAEGDHLKPKKFNSFYMSYDYDVIIIGSGPAGLSCAIQASKLDKKALVVEINPEYYGGAWINTGTVPSKALRVAAKTIYDFHKQYESEDSPKPYERFKMEDLLQYKDRILENQNKKTKEDLFKNDVTTVHGFGKIEGPHTVSVTDKEGNQQEFTGNFILISTGSSPSEPENFEIDHDKILDNKSILEITHIPRRLSIVGSGVNAIEYATMFASLGTHVTLLSAEDVVLPFLDSEIRSHVEEIFADRNIRVLNNVEVLSIDYNPLRTSTEVRYFVDNNDDLQVLETEHVLYFGGRNPNNSGIGLENIAASTDDEGFIKVNSDYKTKEDSVFAAGDIIGFPSLASASFSQGRQAACNMFGIPSLDVPGQIPFGIYSIPEIASIGLTEDEAIAQGYDVTIGRAYFKNITMADIGNKREGLLKMVFETESFSILGIHILGEQACELIHLGQAIMAYKGDIRYYIQHVMNNPTYSEAFRVAAFNGINRVYKAGVKYKNILSD